MLDAATTAGGGGGGGRVWCGGCAAFVPREAFSVSAIARRKRCKACTSEQNSLYRKSHWAVCFAADRRRAARRRGETTPGVTAADVLRALDVLARQNITEEEKEGPQHDPSLSAIHAALQRRRRRSTVSGMGAEGRRDKVQLPPPAGLVVTAAAAP